MIYSAPILTGSARARLETLQGLRRQLSQRLDLALPWDLPLRRFVKGDSYGSSTEIEGFRVKGERRTQLVDDEAGSRPRDRDEQALAGYADAMDHVSTLASDPEFRWDPRVVLDLHFETCRFQKDKSPGRYRSGPIEVTAPEGGIAHSAPAHERVPGLVAELAQSLEREADSTDSVLVAAMAHLNLVSIHPFEDGNGRISRIVQSLVLARDGLLAPEFGSIEPYLAANTTGYYAVLRQVQDGNYSPERDATAWVEFCLRAHIQQAQERIDLIQRAAERWQRLEAEAGSRDWDDRLLIALEQALAGSTDRAAYAGEAGVSNATASSDLRRLTDAGMLKQSGKGRSTRYLPTDRLKKIAAA